MRRYLSEWNCEACFVHFEQRVDYVAYFAENERVKVVLECGNNFFIHFTFKTPVYSGNFHIEAITSSDFFFSFSLCVKGKSE